MDRLLEFHRDFRDQRLAGLAWGWPFPLPSPQSSTPGAALRDPAFWKCASPTALSLLLMVSSHSCLDQLLFWLLSGFPFSQDLCSFWVLGLEVCSISQRSAVHTDCRGGLAGCECSALATLLIKCHLHQEYRSGASPSHFLLFPPSLNLAGSAHGHLWESLPPSSMGVCALLWGPQHLGWNPPLHLLSLSLVAAGVGSVSRWRQGERGGLPREARRPTPPGQTAEHQGRVAVLLAQLLH